MSLFDGEPHVVTEKMKAHWGGCGHKEDTLRCYFCGHRFTEGETMRAVPMGSAQKGLVCGECDLENDADMMQWWKEREKEYMAIAERYWWFIQNGDGE